jgi:predicted MPP superfamily phosphohydrolase
MRNALDIRCTELSFALPGLPPAFDGYRLLHLSDLHLDALPAAVTPLCALLDGIGADLCVMTGDYRCHTRGPHLQIVPPMREIVRAIRTRDGIVATLGNHDEAAMVEPLESLGITMLVNESMRIERGTDAIAVTGIDDVHHFYTDDAAAALRAAPAAFRIAAVHSPEAAAIAADAGCALYLTGHTHHGQVRVGGRMLVSNLHAHHAYAAGTWQHGAMVGYTSAGAGVSGAPLRFDTRGEVAVITLRRDDRGG